MQNNSGLSLFCWQTNCFCIRVLVRPFVGDMFRNLMQTNSWLSWILVKWITKMHVVGIKANFICTPPCPSASNWLNTDPPVTDVLIDASKPDTWHFPQIARKRYVRRMRRQRRDRLCDLWNMWVFCTVCFSLRVFFVEQCRFEKRCVFALSGMSYDVPCVQLHVFFPLDRTY